jgi:hypothetical protein
MPSGRHKKIWIDGNSVTHKKVDVFHPEVFYNT